MSIWYKRCIAFIVILLLQVGCGQAEPIAETAVPTATSASIATTTSAVIMTEVPTVPVTATSQPTPRPTTIPTAAAATKTAVPPTPQPTIDDILAPLEGLPIAQFFEESYKQLLLRSPETVTYHGLAEAYGVGNGSLDNLSDAYIREMQALETAVLALLRGYNRDGLSPEEQVSYDVYEWFLENQVRGHEFIYHDYPLHHFVGSYTFSLNQLFTELHPLTSKQHVEDYISRLAQVDGQVEQLLEGLAMRDELGIRPPTFILEITRNNLLGYLQTRFLDPVTVNGRLLPVYGRLDASLAGIEGLSDAEKEAYREAALENIETSFVPAYFKLIAYIDDTMPLASHEAGVWQFPAGDAYYQHRLQQETSTNLTPEEIHQLGLSEVERIQDELRTAFADLGYPDDATMETLMNQARSDAGYFETTNAGNQAQVIEALETILADMEQRLQVAFERLPEGEVAVIGNPTFAGGGYYESAALDGSRPGTYQAGVGPPRVPKFDLPTIAYHEAIPSHHLQIGLAQELALPTFRTLLFFNGYGEGWALYSERLAYELGAYEADPYGNIGRLQLELLRAIRLVVDTGIHAKGWTRAEGTAYMRTTLGSWTHEVDRYIVWPAQATGYMVGMLEILALRQQAMDALGDQFDLQEFHNVLLGNGSVPLEILQRLVNDYIEAKSTS